MCFGIRKLTLFHLATSILPIQNHKNPKNATNACADTQIYPLLTSSIQYKTPSCSCGPISRGAYKVFDNVFLMNSCILSVWTIFRIKDSVFQVSPISMDDTARPPKRDEEWTITVKDTQALFLHWRTNYWILCSLSVLERTRSQYKGKYLSGRVTKNLTLCRIHKFFFKKYHVKALDQSFPMMYNTI